MSCVILRVVDIIMSKPICERGGGGGFVSKLVVPDLYLLLAIIRTYISTIKLAKVNILYDCGIKKQCCLIYSIALTIYISGLMCTILNVYKSIPATQCYK